MTSFTHKLRQGLRAVPARVWAGLLTVCCLSLTLGALLLSVNVVYVSDSDGNRRMLITGVEDPAELMAMSGIVAEEQDDIYYTAYNGNLASLNIQRAFPVYVQADGALSTTKLCSGTVQQALDLAGITLGEHDYTEPSLHTPIEEDMEITVHRVEYQDTVVDQPIPYETEYRYTSLYHRSRGKTVTLQEGIEGNDRIATRARVVDGVVESSKVVSVERTAEPQNAIIKAYQAGAPVSSMEGPEVVNGVPSTYSRVLTGRATAYSGSGRGASGLGLYEGTVAVDPNVIPYGTKLYITSTDGKFVYGYAIATDTGTALREGHALVDLYFNSYSDAVTAAVHQVNVYIIE